MTTVRAACIQFAARPDKSDSVRDMAPLVAEAAARGADVILLPEKWNAWVDGEAMLREAERIDSGETVEAMAGWAREHHVNLIGGSIAIEAGERVGNVEIVYDRDGNRIGSYTKIHLFDVDVGGHSYRESDGTEPGSDPVVVDIEGVRYGLTVCYDLRFPELYRLLTLGGGATVLTVPSNFTLAHRYGPLGGAAAGARDRKPGVRARHRPARLPRRSQQAVVRPQHDHRPVGDGAGPVTRRRRRDHRRPGFPAAGPDPGVATGARSSPPGLRPQSEALDPATRPG